MNTRKTEIITPIGPLDQGFQLWILLQIGLSQFGQQVFRVFLISVLQQSLDDLRKVTVQGHQLRLPLRIDVFRMRNPH